MGPVNRALRYPRGRGTAGAPRVRVSREAGSPGAPLPRILCPSDLSSCSERALALASAVAGRFGAVLRTLHVVSEAPESRERLDELTSVLDRYRQAGLDAEASIARGDVAGEILREVESWPASLLVIGKGKGKGTHGDTGRKDWALGSVTASVARRARCPVLTVPCPEAAGGSVPAVIRRVLCGLDLGGSSGGTLALALSFARAFEASLDLVHVLEWFFGEADLLNVPELQLDAAEDARERLRRLLPGESSPSGAALIVGAGTPHREILRLARERQADLVVLGAHGRRSLDRSLPGVQLVHLLREVPCPVLVVPAGTGGQAQTSAR